MANKADMLADREAGMTYADIARKHGVSRQRVQQVCGKYQPSYFKFVSEKDCIYPNWRKWMNDEKCSRYELLRRIGNTAHPENCYTLSSYMKGKSYPRKDYIDKLLKATGMSYECLFDDRLWED